MTFTTLTYLLFFCVVFAGYWSLKSRTHQNALLVVASYFFYGWWDFRFCALMMFSSLVDYTITLAIANTEAPRRRKLLMLTSCFINFGLLGFFKYYDFFATSAREAFALAGVHLDDFTLNVVLPAGISFYTFQTMSYTLDVYRRKMNAYRGLFDYLAFVSFFPHLVAGPIMRAIDFLPQFRSERRFDRELAVDGCRQVLWGVVKKLSLADNLAKVVDLAYRDPHAFTGPQLAFATLCFSLQIYCDFSAYADIATGSAKLLGFRLARNFAYPYFSQSPAEFWRRWHITLSTWFRDYVYWPLGGSRVGPARRAFNVLVTFVLSGLWHGASYNFIIWGGLNGLAVLPSLLRDEGERRGVREVPGGESNVPRLATLARMLATFVFICFTWIFFRAATLEEASYIVRKIALEVWQPGKYGGLTLGSSVWLLFLPFLLTEWLRRRELHPLAGLGAPSWVRLALYTVLLWGALFLSPGSSSPFIYFQF